MGRPTRCTRTLAEKVGDLVASGLPATTAAKLVGVPSTTHHRWLQRGLQVEHLPYAEVPTVERPYWTYRAEIERGEAEDERRLVGIVQAHAAAEQPDSWRAARWALERRHRAHWAETRSATTASGERRDAPQGGGLLRIIAGAQADTTVD